jgi:glutathione peroxidase
VSAARSIYDFQAHAITGEPVPLSKFRGQVVLIVNVASECGYTPQYRGLEELYRESGSRGFVVLGFPCNQFGRQEPGAAEDILAFCRASYGVTFPLFAKVNVNGPDAHPLFGYLTSTKRGWLGTRSIKWNFTKFLVDRRGVVVSRHGPRATPELLRPRIERLLDEPA